jgi:hypothetical protein
MVLEYYLFCLKALKITPASLVHNLHPAFSKQCKMPLSRAECAQIGLCSLLVDDDNPLPCLDRNTLVNCVSNEVYDDLAQRLAVSSTAQTDLADDSLQFGIRRLGGSHTRNKATLQTRFATGFVSSRWAHSSTNQAWAEGRAG